MPLPTLPAFFDMNYSEPSSGKLAPDGYLYNDQMFQTLNAMTIIVNSIVNSIVNQSQQVNVFINGIVPPSHTTAYITDPSHDFATDANIENGTLWYNSTLKKLQFKADSGLIETITST